MSAAFIGLGAMGIHMARHLADAGRLSAVCSRDQGKAREFAARHGVSFASRAADCWANAQRVYLCVTADQQVLELVRQLAVPAAAGKLVVDTSTVSTETATHAAALLAAVGARFVDAPITGGTEGAKNAALTFMVGGESADMEEARADFGCMGARVVHMGDVGAGQSTKAVNQVMCAGINQAVTEGMAFAQALGLPIDKVVEVTESGAAGSWFVSHRGRSMVQEQYPPGFKLSLHLKDLRIVQAVAAHRGGHLPVVDQTVTQYQALLEAGHGDEDISTLYRANRRLFPNGE